LPIVLLGVALLLIGLRPPSGEERSGGSVSAVVAARPIASGAVVAAADVTVVTLPASSLDGAWVRDGATVVGRRTLVALPSGAPVLAAELTDAPALAHRLVAVEVTAADAAAASLGDDVDIAAINPDDGTARVVATGRLMASDSGTVASARTVTLDCAAAEALAVVAAEAPGRALHLLVHQR
jgi:hypothetical protein